MTLDLKSMRRGQPDGFDLGLGHMDDEVAAQTFLSSLLSASASSRVGLSARVRISLTRAWKRLLSFDFNGAWSAISCLEPMLDGIEGVDIHQAKLELDLLRAAAFALRDDGANALAIVTSALRRVEGSPLLCIAEAVCRLAYWKQDDLDGYYGVTRCNQLKPSSRAGAYATACTAAMDAAVEFQQLRFHSAERLASEVARSYRMGADYYAAPGLLCAVVVAQVRYEASDFEKAEAILRARLDRINRFGSIESALRAYSTLARIYLQSLQFDAAVQVSRDGEALAVRRGWQRLAVSCLAQRVDIHLAQRQVGQAETCVVELEKLEASLSAPQLLHSKVHNLVTTARCAVLICRGKGEQAIEQLKEVQRAALKSGDHYFVAQVVMRTVDAYVAGGAEEKGLALLSGVLDWGCSRGLFQTILDGGPRVRALLQKVHGRNRSSSGALQLFPYLDGLLQRARDMSVTSLHGHLEPRTGHCLSTRQNAILALLRRGLTTKEIAVELGIAPETVKSHTKQLFFKLSVRTRVEAVSLAERLGMFAD